MENHVGSICFHFITDCTACGSNTHSWIFNIPASESAPPSSTNVESPGTEWLRQAASNASSHNICVVGRPTRALFETLGSGRWNWSRAASCFMRSSSCSRSLSRLRFLTSHPLVDRGIGLGCNCHDDNDEVADEDHDDDVDFVDP